MRRIFIIAALIAACTSAFGQDPVISNNVVVQQNINAAQCPSSWRGAGQPTNEISNTRFGVQSGNTGAVVQSCVGCSYDSRAKSCTCRVCYGYFN